MDEPPTARDQRPPTMPVPSGSVGVTAPSEIDVLARSYAAVIFDLDGTLIDSTPAVERSWQIWAKEYGLSADDLAQAHGIPAATTARRLIAADQVEQAVRRITEIELADTEGITLLPGARAALTALSDRRRAIATSCTRDLYRVRVAAAGVPEPAVVVTVDDVVRGKPDPDPFELAAALLGVDPRACLVFEDAPGGVISAKAAGCRVIGLTTTSTREQLRAAGADAVIGSLAEVSLIEDEAAVRLG